MRIDVTSTYDPPSSFASEPHWFDAAITVITLSLSAVLDADGVSSLWPEHAATLAANTMAVSAANARRIHVFIGVSFTVRCLCGAGVRLRVYICTGRPRAYIYVHTAGLCYSSIAHY